MRNLLSRSTILAAALCASSLAAIAQVLVVPPEDDVLIERFIVEQPLPPPVVLEDNITLRPGSVVPTGVALRPMGGTGSLAKYAYFVSVDGKVVVVDPASRQVVRILSAKR